MVDKTYTIPPGFTWSHTNDAYMDKDYRRWDDRTNVIYDKDGNIVHDHLINQPAPRVTPDDVERVIKGEEYVVRGTLTLCILTLQNGFQVTGESACADPANFNEELGRKIARGKAKEKIWPMLGYVLRERLHKEQTHGNS